MTPFIEDGIIQAPIYIYRISERDQADPDMFLFKGFLMRRIEEDGYISECFNFRAEFEDGYHKLVARPISFYSFWADPSDGGDEAYG